VHDITDRLLAEAERRATEARLDGILRQVPALVWTTDRDFVIQSAGGAGFAALGIEAHALVGRAISEIVADAELAPALAAHREALTGAQTHYVQALGARRFDIQLQPFRDAAGAIAGCIGVGIECTERLAPALR
jgi:PAS domain-containing protein